jgi:hypothetical protein
LAAYKDSRKRNFPTRENLEKKKKEEEEMKQRGELVPPKPTRFNNDRKRKPETAPEHQPVAKEPRVDDADQIQTEETDEETSEALEQPKKTVRKQNCTWYLRGNCKFGGRCSFVHDPHEREKSIENFYNQPRRAGSLVLPKPTQNLLHKLVEKEVHVEQSMILQCFRYIVQSDFLTKDRPSDSSE